MALVRVYCGISSIDSTSDESEPAEDFTSRLTAAVVDDSGRLLEYCEINDDPTGYALLTALLAERFGGSASMTVAVDNDDHLVTSLLAAAGRAVAYSDDDAADEFAERFADDESVEEIQAGPSERRSIGLARALQAGVLSPAFTGVAREFATLKPILCAHAALAVGRHASAAALREVLRELYPAALRAFADPAEPVALAVLALVSEPGMLASGTSRRDSVDGETVTAHLVADGVCDATTAGDAVTALRVAISETPRRSGLSKALVPAVTAAVRQAVFAVQAADDAITTMISALVERVAPATTPPLTLPPRRTSITITSAPPAQGSTGRVRSTITSAPPAQGSAGRAQPPQPMPVSDVPTQPRPLEVPPVAPTPVSRPVWAPTVVPPAPPGFEPTPVSGTPLVTFPAAVSQERNPTVSTERPSTPSAAPADPAPASIPAQRSPRAPAPADTGAPFVPTLTQAAISSQRANRGLGATPADRPVSPGAPTAAAPASPMWPSPASAQSQPVRPEREFGHPAPAPVTPAHPLTSVAPPVAATDPSQPNGVVPAHLAGPPGSRANWPLVGDDEIQAKTPDRVTPPWQTDDLVLPDAPALRLVESSPRQSPADPSPGSSPMSRHTAHDELDIASPRSRGDGHGRIKPRRTERNNPPAPVDDDDDLLIFSSVSTAWFGGDDEPTWNSKMDLGWQAAEQAARAAEAAYPAMDDAANGLPRRVPQANLVPGSPIDSAERPLRIVRDAADIAAHTSSYFQGWRRGNQEVGGFALGGRAGRGSAVGWDFNRDHDIQDDRDDQAYRAVNYR